MFSVSCSSHKDFNSAGKCLLKSDLPRRAPRRVLGQRSRGTRAGAVEVDVEGTGARRGRRSSGVARSAEMDAPAVDYGVAGASRDRGAARSAEKGRGAVSGPGVLEGEGSSREERAPPWPVSEIRSELGRVGSGWG